MKADDCVRLFNQYMVDGPPDVWNGRPEHVTDDADRRLLDSALGICFVLHKEASTLIEKRKVQSGSAILGVLRELHQKWKAFVSRVPEHHLNKYFFRVYLQQRMPELSLLLERNLT